MAILTNLSDDELALAGCLGALLLAFGLIAGSYHLRRIFRTDHLETDHVGVPGKQPNTAEQNCSTERRAA